MSEVETYNKIRLNQVRRAEAVKVMIDRADGIKSDMSIRQKNQIIAKKYGKESEEKDARKYASKLGRMTTPLGAVKTAKNLVTAPKNVKVSDVPIYGMAMILAFFKDLLDVAVIGALPAVGTVITFCISMAIGFILLFDDVSTAQRQIARKLTKKFLILIAGTMIEGIFFGLNFLPFEMITVAIIYWISLMDRKKQY